VLGSSQRSGCARNEARKRLSSFTLIARLNNASRIQKPQALRPLHVPGAGAGADVGLGFPGPDCGATVALGSFGTFKPLFGAKFDCGAGADCIVADGVGLVVLGVLIMPEL